MRIEFKIRTEKMRARGSHSVLPFASTVGGHNGKRRGGWGMRDDFCETGSLTGRIVAEGESGLFLLYCISA